MISESANRTQLDRSNRSLEIRQGRTLIGERSTDYLWFQAPIIVSPPNITINIELNPKTDFNINIHDLLKDVEQNQNDLHQNINISIGQNGSFESIPPSPKMDTCACKDGSVPGCYDSINRAVKEVKDNGNVTIYAGTYNESIVIDKSLRLKGEDNHMTTIVVHDQDGILVSGGENVSIEDISMVNKYITRNKTIGLNVQSKKAKILMKNCSISNFAIGVKSNNYKKMEIVGNHIYSSSDLRNLCKYCKDNDGNKIYEPHNYTAGLWLTSSCNEDIEIRNNTSNLVNNSMLHTFAIMLWNRGGNCQRKLIGYWEDSKNNSFLVEPTCKTIQLTGENEALGLHSDCL